MLTWVDVLWRSRWRRRRRGFRVRIICHCILPREPYSGRSAYRNRWTAAYFTLDDCGGVGRKGWFGRLGAWRGSGPMYSAEQVDAMLFQLWRAGYIDAAIPKVERVLPGTLTTKGFSALKKIGMKGGG